ncbi:hypothetical protein DFH27DRAFT_649886 [Peziza echinospora]|nr:hypothetical protein DFH27DRAFT_649886 [Peziza echinospora]
MRRPPRPMPPPPPPPLTLHHFLLRTKTLSLYRHALRTIAPLKRTNPGLHGELRAYARGEIERHRDVADVERIRFLVREGRREVDGVEGWVRGR